MKRILIVLSVAIIGTTFAGVWATDFGHLTQGRTVMDALGGSSKPHVKSPAAYPPGTRIIATEPEPEPMPAGEIVQVQMLSDPTTATGYLRKGPSVIGTKLNLKPGETATQKALQLQDELQAAKLREDELRGRVADLEKEIDQKNTRLVEAIREMNSTRQELISVRSQLESWAQNMAQLREKIKAAEADNLATMQTIIGLLQQFLQVESDMKERQREPLDLEKLLESQQKGPKK